MSLQEKKGNENRDEQYQRLKLEEKGQTGNEIRTREEKTTETAKKKRQISKNTRQKATIKGRVHITQ